MNPSLEHFQLLRRLRQQLRHQNGTGIVYLFSDYALANQWLSAELDAHLRAHSLRLQILVPSKATEPPFVVLTPILASQVQTVGIPYWLALGEPDLEWDHYRDQVLARLNENRSVLDRSRIFIFLVLPTHFENRAAEIAPDLWSIRSASFVVAPWRSGTDEGNNGTPTMSADVEMHSKTETPLVEAVVQRWQRQWQAWCDDRSQQLSPSLAWQLAYRYLAHLQPGQAQLYATQALEISRELKTLNGEMPQSLRDLSVSLELVGDVARDLGQLEEARTAFDEAQNLLGRLRAVHSADASVAAAEKSVAAKIKQIDQMLKSAISPSVRPEPQ